MSLERKPPPEVIVVPTRAEYEAALAERAASFDRDVTRRMRDVRARREAERRVADLEAAERAAAQGFPLDAHVGWSLVDDLAQPSPDDVWAVERFHMDGSNSLLVATYKTGKTTLSIDLCKSLADGEPFLGVFGVKPLTGRVVHFDYELTPALYQAWARDMEFQHPERVVPLHLRGWPAIPFWVPSVRARWARWLRERDAEWLIVDPASQAWRGLVDNENDNSQVGRFLSALDELKREGGVTNLVLTAHTGRAVFEEGSERSRGATKLEDWPDGIWYFTKDAAGRRSLRAIGRDVEVEALDLEWNGNSRRTRHTGRTRTNRREEDAAQAAVDALAINGDGLNVGELRKKIRGSREGRQHGIPEAVRRGWIRQEHEGQALHNYLTPEGREQHERTFKLVSHDDHDGHDDEA